MLAAIEAIEFNYNSIAAVLAQGGAHTRARRKETNAQRRTPEGFRCTVVKVVRFTLYTHYTRAHLHTLHTRTPKHTHTESGAVPTIPSYLFIYSVIYWFVIFSLQFTPTAAICG